MNVRQGRELVIVGGGPAGLAAAIEARRAGIQTTVIEERTSLGGQIYKQLPRAFKVLAPPSSFGKDYVAGRHLIEAAEASGAEIRLDTVAYGIWGKDVAIYTEGVDAGLLTAERIILATGAYDRPVAFPGWTLPGVMTAGGAQSLIKTQKVLPGERILMAGSGPLILAFSAQLHHYGANVVGVLEAAPFPTPGAIAHLLRASRGNAGLLLDGLGYMAYLRRKTVPFDYSHVVIRAEGRDEVERAVVARVGPDWRPIPGTERAIEVDTVCVGYGFFPSVELSMLCGCKHTFDEDLGGHVPVRDESMRSSVDGILIAGDGAGVAGSIAAVQEGRIAGLTAALELGRLGEAEAARRSAPARRRLATVERFRSALAEIYKVGPGIYDLWTPDTVVCRCEEVTAGEIMDNILGGSADPSSVKSLTRAGMGQCQGRNCARQVASLVARQAGRDLAELPTFTPRAPVKAVPIALIAEERPEEEPVAEVG